MNAVSPIFIEDPAVALASDDAWVAVCATIKAEVEAFTPDLATTASRAKIAGLAYKITKTKTAIDAAGLALTEEARKKIGVVNGRRSKIKAELEALAEAVRKPLTDWEAAEKARTDRADLILAEISQMATLQADDGTNMIGDRIATVQALVIDEDTFRDFLPEALAIREKAIAILEVARARAKQHEADRAELAELRAREAERDAAAAATAKAAQEKEAAEKKAEATRLREEAAASARQRAQEEAVQRAQEEEQRKAAAAIAEAEARAAAVIAAAEDAERQRLAVLAHADAAEKARAADRAHRTKIIDAAENAICDIGTSLVQAQAIVKAIVAGEIPNVTLRF